MYASEWFTGIDSYRAIRSFAWGRVSKLKATGRGLVLHRRRATFLEGYRPVYLRLATRESCIHITVRVLTIIVSDVFCAALLES